MSNSLSAFTPAYWARAMQEIFFKENVAIALATTELRTYLNDGDTVHKPYRSYLAAQTYSKGTDISTFNDLTATDEYLTVDTAKVVPFYVDDLDRIQNKWDAATTFAQDAQRVLNNILDQAVLAEYSNARSYISAQDLGGSGTGSIAITESNISNLFAVAARKLEAADVPTGNLCAVIGPRLMETLKLYVGGRETGFGDTVGANGKVGTRFGFDIYQSNNIPFSATLTTSSIPVDGETITIDGVVFTWEATGTNCSSAGEVDIKDSEDNAYANLVVAINASAAESTSTYKDVSASDRKKLRKHGIVASYTTHALVISGYGDVAITEATTNCAVTTNTQYPVFMMKGAIDLVTQKSPSVEFRVAEKRLGRYVYPWMLYGKKTFDSMKDALTYCKVDTSSWV